MRALVTEKDLRNAAALLAGVTVRTPLVNAPDLGERVFLKAESLQRGGSFKLRGAYSYVSKLDPKERARGVIAPSSGNHAQAVALAARLFDVPCIAVMPTTVTAPKRAGAERLGARIELCGTTTTERMDRALELSRETGATVVPPFDHPTIIAGQGTVGLEIVEDLPDVATVIVPVGGGGLSAGVATAVKLLRPKAEVIGVEPKSAPKLTRALEADKPVDIGKTSGLADGLLAVRIGDLPFAHHVAYLDRVVTIEDAPLRRATRFLLERTKLVVEPSGAIGVAALLEGSIAPSGTVAVVLSGGNIEWDGLSALLAAG